MNIYLQKIATYQSELFFELGSYNNLAQLAESPIFSLKYHSTPMYLYFDSL